MKKFLLSATVLGVFGAYALHTKLDTEASPVIAVRSPFPESTASVATETPVATLGPTPVPSQAPISTPTPAGKYKDGTYTGGVADAFYGNIQVQAVISGGRITDVIFLQYPNDRSTSVYINSQAMPLLKQEAIQAQSAQVDGVSGATASSGAFIESLKSALNKAV